MASLVGLKIDNPVSSNDYEEGRKRYSRGLWDREFSRYREVIEKLIGF